MQEEENHIYCGSPHNPDTVRHKSSRLGLLLPPTALGHALFVFSLTHEHDMGITE